MRETLESYGATVLEAEDGKQALAIISQKWSNLGLIISDLQMPNMNGKELLEELIKRGIKIPFAFASGRHEERVELIRKGAFSFLTKPLSNDDLKRLMEKIWP